MQEKESRLSSGQYVFEGKNGCVGVMDWNMWIVNIADKFPYTKSIKKLEVFLDLFCMLSLYILNLLSIGVRLYLFLLVSYNILKMTTTRRAHWTTCRLIRKCGYHPSIPNF